MPTTSKLTNFSFGFFSICAVLLFFGCQQENEKVMPENHKPINRLVTYNRWANEQFVNWLMEYDEALLSAYVESSFPSIRATVIHNWGAETGWTSYLQNKEWQRPYEGDSFPGNTKDALLQWLEASKRLEDFIHHADLTVINEQLQQNDMEYSAEDVVMHVVNHATQHRGQIITMARTLGLQNIPRTDLIFFAKEN